ncbi:MAG: SGNH/GDSL hydrolase family protein [Bacteroidales bacterium]|nr:SGNH/GDSL hydrolase family protein [Bacteroidales bacterium]
MKGFFHRLRDIWIIFGITLLILILIEVFFKIYFAFNKEEDQRLQADYFKNKNWVQDYNKEFNKCNQERWQPYVYWKRKPFSGQYINIGENGLRKTIFTKEPYVEARPEVKIFFFGGSTIWGTWVRDSYTIPSIVGGGLNKNDVNAVVTNFGESGYVSTQEILELELQLQQGNTPDIVVFYDGVNDVFSAFQQGIAGIPQNEFNRRKEFNTLNSKKKSMLAFFESLRTLSTMKFITQLTKKDTVVGPSYSEKELKTLSQDAIDIYNENIKMVYALAKTYDFKVIFYWQPTIFNKLVLSEYEKKQASDNEYLREFTKSTNNKLEQKEIHFENLDFFDISDIFLNETEPVFIDYCHVSEYGNSVIARRMVNDILGLLKPAERDQEDQESESVPEDFN